MNFDRNFIPAILKEKNIIKIRLKNPQRNKYM